MKITLHIRPGLTFTDTYGKVSLDAKYTHIIETSPNPNCRLLKCKNIFACIDEISQVNTYDQSVIVKLSIEIFSNVAIFKNYARRILSGKQFLVLHLIKDTFEKIKFKK